MRHFAAYATGGCPIRCLNRSVNAERDIAAIADSVSRLQVRAGDAWIARNAAAIAGRWRPA
ncbi:hypothetical protein [Luteimonas terrae]|uniref:Uncharacterized protein n=1 Tax=Luteimonas terrae TaxID=1530191 RepID=A0A4R5U8Y8_9GAMM|nr:hypothetical protein [Luteimonas terrae]TDK30957.1 hypothetical protein E2F49_11515 [Luteimonas terrae]